MQGLLEDAPIANRSLINKEAKPKIKISPGFRGEKEK
jgi:hypothetical protein